MKYHDAVCFSILNHTIEVYSYDIYQTSFTQTNAYLFTEKSFFPLIQHAPPPDQTVRPHRGKMDQAIFFQILSASALKEYNVS